MSNHHPSGESRATHQAKAGEIKMAKLTKAQRKQHNAALEILKKDVLTEKEKEFVLIHYNEGAETMNGAAGAFFTPLAMAFEFAFEVGSFSEPGKVRFLDLCAGIGTLSYAVSRRNPGAKITCVEINPTYIAVGKKILPEAVWIHASALDLTQLQSFGRFDVAYSNPPFGKVDTLRGAAGPLYTGGEAEYKIIDIASHLAEKGYFILPQASAGFRYSGVQFYQEDPNRKYTTFTRQTGLELTMGMGFDTTFEGMFEWYDPDTETFTPCGWKQVNPRVEFVTCNFDDREELETLAA